MEYWYMYINSSLVNDVTSNGEGRGGEGMGEGEKRLCYFVIQLKCLTRGSGKKLHLKIQFDNSI